MARREAAGTALRALARLAQPSRRAVARAKLDGVADFRLGTHGPGAIPAMRVAFDAACFRLDRAGTARAAAGLLGALVAMAEPPDVALLGDGPPVDRGTVARRLTVLDQDLAWYGRGLAAAARRAGADILHCPTFRGPLTRPAQPLVVTVLDLAVLREPGWFPRWSRTYGAFAVPRRGAIGRPGHLRLAGHGRRRLRAARRRA